MRRPSVTLTPRTLLLAAVLAAVGVCAWTLMARDDGDARPQAPQQRTAKVMVPRLAQAAALLSDRYAGKASFPSVSAVRGLLADRDAKLRVVTVRKPRAGAVELCERHAASTTCIVLRDEGGSVSVTAADLAAARAQVDAQLPAG